jgi:hypothetical protein
MDGNLPWGREGWIYLNPKEKTGNFFERAR